MKEKVLNKIKSELNIGFTEKSDTKKKNGSTFTSGIGDNLINPKKVKH
jgi:hypothetical protein